MVRGYHHSGFSLVLREAGRLRPHDGPATGGAGTRHLVVLYLFDNLCSEELGHQAGRIGSFLRGLGEVGRNFASINDPAKWILCVAMLLGRLEIFTLLVLFSPAFWRK